MDPIIRSTKTSTPVFPCWLWSTLYLEPKWVRYPRSDGYTGPMGWHPFWHPDQTEPPVAIPLSPWPSPSTN